jgi:hypothetical protein
MSGAFAAKRTRHHAWHGSSWFASGTQVPVPATARAGRREPLDRQSRCCVWSSLVDDPRVGAIGPRARTCPERPAHDRWRGHRSHHPERPATGRLRRAVLGDTYPPGARNVETRVAMEFGTSRAPVCAQHDRLVVRRPAGGRRTTSARHQRDAAERPRAHRGGLLEPLQNAAGTLAKVWPERDNTDGVDGQAETDALPRSSGAVKISVKP